MLFDGVRRRIRDRASKPIVLEMRERLDGAIVECYRPDSFRLFFGWSQAWIGDNYILVHSGPRYNFNQVNEAVDKMVEVNQYWIIRYGQVLDMGEKEQSIIEDTRHNEVYILP